MEAALSLRLETLQTQVQQAARVVELIQRVQSAKDFSAAVSKLATELSKLAGNPAAVGWCDAQGQCRLSSLSSPSPHERLWEACLRESVMRESPARWPVADEGQRHLLLAHRQLAVGTGATCLVSAPLRRGDEKICGAMAVIANPAEAEGFQRFLAAAADPLAGTLSLVEQIPHGRWQRLVEQAKQLSSKTGLVCLAVTLVLAGALAFPVTHEVNSSCVLQPVVRRYVPAPFEGRLERTLVEPGDVVTEGQILARLEGRDLQLEISQILSDLHRASKERDGYLAEKEFGRAEVSRFEMERLQGKVDLWERKAGQLEIRSPLDGIVLTGDLRKLEGAPLRIGQTLFEIAPLDDMTAEIEVPDEDVAFVAKDQSVEMRFEAYPDRGWSGTIGRLHPRSETRQQNNVFIAEVQLTNSNAQLRPGMSGRAAIKVGSRSLGWVLLHRLRDRFLM